VLEILERGEQHPGAVALAVAHQRAWTAGASGERTAAIRHLRRQAPRALAKRGMGGAIRSSLRGETRALRKDAPPDPGAAIRLCPYRDDARGGIPPP
jgi:hypothetical protein